MFTNRQVILARHGASEWSSLGRYQGHSPVPLSSLGIQQANALANEIYGYHPDKIVSSDLPRAQQTAQIIANHLSMEVHTDERLRELNCGIWAGLTEREIEKLDFQIVTKLRAGQDIPRGGGETMLDLKRRIHSALTDWVQGNFFNTLLIVSHAYVIKTIIQVLLAEEGNYQYQKNSLPSLGSYTVLECTKGGKWVLEKYGFLPEGDSYLNTVQWQPTL